MKRLETIKDLAEFRRGLASRPQPETSIRVCSTGCRALGALEVCEALEAEVARRSLAGRVRIVRVGCHGLCAGAVTMVIDPKGIFYKGVSAADVPDIIEQTVLAGKVVKRLCWSGGGRTVSRQKDVPFYKHQMRRVLANCGVVDPTSLEDAVAHGAYASAAQVLSKMTPDEIIDEMTRSGLRGRGGAGFPTGKKWQLARQAQGEPKYIICNADEGDPGAFKDRVLLEGDPHLVIEGMIIGAYAVGARHGVIYVRAEYPIAFEYVEIALAQAREAGLLGENILGSGFAFDMEVHKGSGAYICGEETALIASVEGQRGMPRARPPFPVSRGLFAKPTSTNNVETWANVTRVIQQGAAAYAEVGTAASKGTKIFCLSGAVKNTGLVELPFGATLRQIICDIGGGVPGNRRMKAALVGGPCGGCVPADSLDVPMDFDSLQRVGAMMGSGGIIVADESACMVDLARHFAEFAAVESCGNCVPCRVGTRRMVEILTRIADGRGQPQDIDHLQSLGELLNTVTLCGMAPNPVLSTIRYFRDEYEAHIRRKQCPSHACKALAPAPCSSACPAHVNVPEYVALVGEGRFTDALDVIRRRNPFASVCGRACHHPCEMYCRRGDVDQPVAIRHLKRFVSDRAKDAQPPKWQGPRRGKVAIIGAGPAGLTAAYFLALAGREVKVFESLPVAGGMLAVGVPEYRLPRTALKRDIDYICRAGVEIELNRRVGSLQELRDAGYDAVFVATGAHASVRLDVPGATAEGVHDAIAFLRRVTLDEIKELSGRVIVIGGGNAAIDAARAAQRLGADPVTILYRRTREEMPALREEIEDAILEGVDIRYLVAPMEIQGDGRVRAVRCQEMELGPADESGRRRPVPKPGSEQVFPADHVIVAVGQAPELDFASSDGRLVVTKGKVSVDPVTQKAGDGIFMGGDAATGPATIIEAIAAGQRAAQAIDVFLGGKGDLPSDTGIASPGKPDDAEAKGAVPFSLFSEKGTVPFA